MSNLQLLRQRIESKTVVVGIYGLGYVGLPLALRFTEVGLKVIGFDIDAAKVSKLNAGAVGVSQSLEVEAAFVGNTAGLLPGLIGQAVFPDGSGKSN